MKQDQAAAANWFQRAAFSGNPAAQTRLARMLAVGAGRQADPVAAATWYFIARRAGLDDPWLADFVAKLPADQLDKAVAAAARWSGP